MNKHSEKNIEAVECPFEIGMNTIDWDSVKTIISVDDVGRSVIVEMEDGSKFIVSIPSVLYNSIFKSGEDNVIEQDFGFNELT